MSAEERRGHTARLEAEYRPMSEHIYALSWAGHVTAAGTSGTLFAGGHSCRPRAKPVDGAELRHPVRAALAAIRDSTDPAERRDGTPRGAGTAAFHQTRIDAEAAR